MRGAERLQLQLVTHDEATSRHPRPEAPFIGFDLERSFRSLHRYRGLASARHLVALFDTSGDRSRTVH
jgi:hypothetical protein